MITFLFYQLEFPFISLPSSSSKPALFPSTADDTITVCQTLSYLRGMIYAQQNHREGAVQFLMRFINKASRNI